MTTDHPHQPPPSAQLMQMFFGFMVSDALSAAAELGVADLLKGGPKSADELARVLGVHARSLHRLLRALASVGVFAQDGDGRFRLTPLGGPLRSDDPDSLRSFMVFMGTDWHHRTWADLPHSIQTGQPAFERLYGKPYFDYLAEHPEPARVFHDAMTSLSASSGRAVAEAYDFSGVRRLVDVGGGTGCCWPPSWRSTRGCAACSSTPRRSSKARRG